MLSPSTLAIRCQRFAGQFVGRDYKYAVWLRVRYVNNTQIPAGVRLSENYPRPVPTRAIFACFLQYVCDLVFIYPLIMNVRFPS